MLMVARQDVDIPFVLKKETVFEGENWMSFWKIRKDMLEEVYPNSKIIPTRVQ